MGKGEGFGYDDEYIEDGELRDERINSYYYSDSLEEGSQTLAKSLARFAMFMENIDCDSGFKDIMFVLSKLHLLKIRENYVLDAFKCGSFYGYTYQIYCHQIGASKEYLPVEGYIDEFGCITSIPARKKLKENTPYTDNYYIRGIHPPLDVADIPRAINYFKLPFTEEGIFQAWLLDNLHEFMPRGWHDNYNHKLFITGQGVIDKLFPDWKVNLVSEESDPKSVEIGRKVRSLDVKDLVPKIEMEGDSAKFSFSFWNLWKGLVKATVKASRNGDSVVFDEPEVQVLVKYSCSIVF